MLIFINLIVRKKLLWIYIKLTFYDLILQSETWLN